ncbi:hypothetical protein EWM64_g5774 [Hericium alpestre]|uniref:Sugar phosphate phosphatase n=1 Tax=Hericium alpestre TaxID=135208 RepID=A0A4Y9ZTW1_9AGAM|nr:hypothetical protein EWM64_g5774 [Hericium alpestre]
MPITSSDFEAAIRASIPVTHLEIIDESSGCGDKYAVLIVSEVFAGKTTLARHRMVNEVLKNEIAAIHAFTQLSITPSSRSLFKVGDAMSAFNPPYPPYDPTDKAGFSYETVVKRWPVILTGIIDSVYNLNHELSVQSGEQAAEKIEEGKGLIEKISKLKYQMGRDHPLEPIEEDGEPLVDEYNEELARLAEDKRNTWFTAPWLYAECYLYRFFRSYVAKTKHWRNYDPFLAQKQKTFQASGTAIYKLATTMHELEEEKAELESDPDKLEVIFREMIQMCLGNATDLSLLTHMSHEDIQHLQTVGRDAQLARKEFILKDDQSPAWEHIKTLRDGRVDFVLDNAGFELFTDFVFADFLVTYTPYVSRVIFH